MKILCNPLFGIFLASMLLFMHGARDQIAELIPSGGSTQEEFVSAVNFMRDEDSGIRIVAYGQDANATQNLFGNFPKGSAGAVFEVETDCTRTPLENPAPDEAFANTNSWIDCFADENGEYLNQ